MSSGLSVMVSSSSLPRPLSSISELQQQQQQVNQEAGSSGTSNNTKPSLPLMACKTEMDISSTAATTIAFATPENSPFVSESNRSNNIRNPSLTNTSLSTQSSNCRNQAGSSDARLNMANTNTANLSPSLSASPSFHNRTSMTVATSVTPSDKCVKFQDISGSSNGSNSIPIRPDEASCDTGPRKAYGPLTPQRVGSAISHPISTAVTTAPCTGNTLSHLAPPAPAPSTSLRVPSSSFSRIPSLQPRKVTAEAPQFSSGCSDAGSVPPSLCSSAGTPENDAIGDAKHHMLQMALAGKGPKPTTNTNNNNTGTGVKLVQRIGRGSSALSQQQQSMSLQQQGTHDMHKPENLSSNFNDVISTTTNNTNMISSNNNTMSSSTSNRNNSSLSPVPRARTPVRSPISSRNKNRQFDFDLSQFGSPGIFLSPCLPSPPDSRQKGMGMDRNGEKAGATPTNFANDFCKADLSSISFDPTNALPWLSPNPYALFSPGGGMASAINTPGGLFSTLPKTPNGSKITLPNTSEVSMDTNTRKSASGISSMICVSPLASRKNCTSSAAATTSASLKLKGPGGHLQQSSIQHHQPETPIDFKDVFASPKSEYRGVIRTDHSNEIPTLASMSSDITNDEMSARLSLEKPMAERDVREDEDLNVLLKLAEMTPNRKAEQPKSRLFRSQFGYIPHHQMDYGAGVNIDPPQSLHLPFIDKNGPSPPQGPLLKKNPSTKNDDFIPPLSIRPHSSGKGSVKPMIKKGGPSTTKSGLNNSNGLVDRAPTTSASASKPIYNAHHPHAKFSHHPGLPPHLNQHPAQHPYPPPHPPYNMHQHGPQYFSYQPPPPRAGHPPPTSIPMYPGAPVPGSAIKSANDMKKTPQKGKNGKRGSAVQSPPATNDSKKRAKKTPSRAKGGKRARTTVTQPLSGHERKKSAATITAINAATGNKNDKAASLASAILRGVTMRPSGKWQAQLYYAGKSRYIGVFDTREKAALAYEIAREQLKADKSSSEGAMSLKETEANVNAARKAAFEGVNEKDPRYTK
mmetsp:Transcript_20319/g.25025  ORF Transcript_20319/g.25025 Transcript_20319/m.25025 type:complete len:1028 (-) Transcript_20319:317-3400(-)